MQHLTPSDHLTGAARSAIDTALADARTQRVGGAVPAPAEAGHPTPQAEGAPATSAPAPNATS